MLFKIGKILKPHGLKGVLKVYPYSKERGDHFEKGVYFIEGRPYNLEWTGKIGSNLTLKFAEVVTRNDADALAGKEIEIEESELLPLKKNEYYIHQIIDCEVFDSTGLSVGRVVEVIHAPAGDVIDVRNEETVITILFKDVSVEKVDIENRSIYLKHPKKYYEI